MDPQEILAVRWHVNGKFVNEGGVLQYIGGSEGMSYIDRMNISLVELRGHVIRDHGLEIENKRFYWRFSGRELMVDGLMLLLDDSRCQAMCDGVAAGAVVEIYVEDTGNVCEEEDMDCLIDVPPLAVLRHLHEMRGGKPESFVTTDNRSKLKRKYKKKKKEAVKEVEMDDEKESSDSDYMPADESSSGEEEETSEIRKDYKVFRKRMKYGEHSGSLDDELFPEGSQAGEGNEQDNILFEESTDFENSFDEGSDGHVVKKQSIYPRFKKKNKVPQFSLGMKFGSKEEFKQAIIAYGLARRKLIRFEKNDAKRVRAKCDWHMCPWVCLLVATSRTSNWQITSFNDLHYCPPRKDNRMVTSSRIAAKYEKLIRSNPTWKISAMKAHIEEEMFANVSIDKVKRAKRIVMQKWLDATKGQYTTIFDYQLELIRSNPVSTVVVKLEPDCEEPIFRRIYVCLDALKRGFMAGCRRVVGLDGCFFKGATNGELLCAVGRDANNQIYPIAWAVVEKESNDSWDWSFNCYATI